MTMSFIRRSWRRWLAVGGLTAALVCVCAIPSHAVVTGSGLVPRHLAIANGLERAWFARAEVNPHRSQVVRWLQNGDDLFLVTTAGVVQSMNADTGATQWTTPIGQPDYPSLGPAANEHYVAVINGSTLYLLDRTTGRIVHSRSVGGPPGGGPALGDNFAFAPLMNGRVEGYPLDSPRTKSWFYQSWGHVLAAPRVTPESVVWGTDAGFLYVARVNPPRINFRLQATGEFSATPAYRAPLIFGVSADGDCFAIDERTGQLQWKYVTGFPTERGPAVVGDRLYLSTDEPMLHAVNANTGLIEWEAPGVSQFAAASKTHVYGIDRFGNIHILDHKTGAPLGLIVSGGVLTALVNDQTDRLYLMSDSGLVQCLHEIGAKEPTYYGAQPTADTPAATEEAPAAEEYDGQGEPAEEEAEVDAFSEESTVEQFDEAPAEEADPFGAPAAEEDPFGAPVPEPAAPESDSGAAEDNPFE